MAIVAASLAIGFLIDRFHLGGDPAGDGMLSGLIMLPMCLAALILAVVAFVMTVRARAQLNVATRLFGLFPIVAYGLVMVVDLVL